MSQKTITIILDANAGTAETETKGFRGGECKKNPFVKAARAALGEISNEHDTPEMRLAPTGATQHQHVQG